MERSTLSGATPTVTYPPCPNGTCPDHGKSEQVGIYTRYGRKQIRLLICRTCGKTYSETKGTPLWDARLDYLQIEYILASVVDGHGIRKIARGEGAETRGRGQLSKNTVKRFVKLAMQDPPTLFKQVCEHVEFSYEELLAALRLQAEDTVLRGSRPKPPKRKNLELAEGFLKRFGTTEKPRVEVQAMA